jgi:hypothetical protein
MRHHLDIAPSPVPRFIAGIVPDGEEEAQCIRIAHPSGMYVTDDLIPVHNTDRSDDTPKPAPAHPTDGPRFQQGKSARAPNAKARNGKEPGQTDILYQSAKKPSPSGEESESFRATEQAYGGREAWEKAKAAERTKLNYRQWVQVRTPEFKKWFGDWEAAALRNRIMATHEVNATAQGLSESSNVKALRDDAVSTYKGPKQVRNADIGETIRITKRGIENSLQHGMKKEKRAVVSVLDKLLENAVFMARDTENMKPGVRAVETFAHRVAVDGKPFVARLIVRELSDGRRFYDHELSTLESERPAGKSGGSEVSFDNRQSEPRPTASLGKRILDDALDVNPDSVSKAVDPDTGEPLPSALDDDKTFYQRQSAQKRAPLSTPAELRQSLGRRLGEGIVAALEKAGILKIHATASDARAAMAGNGESGFEQAVSVYFQTADLPGISKNSAAWKAFAVRMAEIEALSAEDVAFRRSNSGKTAYLVRGEETLATLTPAQGMPKNKDEALALMANEARATLETAAADFSIAKAKRKATAEKNVILRARKAEIAEAAQKQARKIATAHHNRRMDYKPFAGDFDPKTDVLLHSSPGYGKKPGSFYFLTLIDGQPAYVRLSDHWGHFETREHYDGTQRLQEGDRLDPSPWGTSYWKAHNWTLEGLPQNDGQRHSGYVLLKDLPEVPNGAAIETRQGIDYQSAWHGSPHTFDEFSLDAIGSGEGNQIHGWGIYALRGEGKERKRHADKRYRQRLLDNSGEEEKYRFDLAPGFVYDWTNAGWAYRENNDFDNSGFLDDKHNAGEVLALDALRENDGDTEEAIDWLKERQEDEDDTADEAAFKEALELLEGGAEPVELGNLYRIEIPDDDVLLDEDKTLSEQPEKVRVALREIVEEQGLDLDEIDWDVDTGKEFYEALSEHLGGDEDTSRLLSSKGVEGIAYVGDVDGPAAVVFDDQVIQVLDRYYQNQTAASGTDRLAAAQGAFDGKTVHLIAENLSPDEVTGTLLHEFWHKALKAMNLAGDPAYTKLRNRLRMIEKLAGQRGPVSEWFQRAYDRIPEADRNDPGKSFNELAAYAITEYENAPRTLPQAIAKWVQDFLAAVRAFLIRKTGYMPKNLTAADLSAIARNFLREEAKRVESEADVLENGRWQAAGEAAFSEGTAPFTPDAFDAREFAAAVDRIAKMKEAPRTVITMGDTPAVLRALGARALPIQISPSVIHKATRDKHEVPISVVRDLPTLLSNPIAVFDSHTGQEALVALVEANDTKGNPVLVAVHLNASGEGFNTVNKIASVYGKDKGKGAIFGWMSDGSLRYFHKEKASQWLHAARLQLPGANTIERLNPHAITEADVVKGDGLLFSIADDSGRNYTPAQRQMFHRIGRDTTPKTIPERLRGFREWANKTWKQGLFDQFDPIKALSGHAYMLARLSKGASGAFEALLHHGKLSLKDGVYDADTSGGAIETIFKPIGKETSDFLTWVAGNRAERLMGEGKENLFTKDDIIAAKSLASDKTDFDYTLPSGQTTRNRAMIFADTLRKFNAFNKNVLDMAEQSGLIDGEDRKAWEHEFYVPFYRVAEDEGDGAFRGMSIGKGLARQKAFERLKGGKEQLNDLLTNTLANWAHLIDASAKNRAALATLKAAEKLGAAKPVESRFQGKSSVWVMENGKKVDYTIDDPHLLVALTALDFSGMRGPVMDALSTTKRWLTIGVTFNPAFKMRNLIRDSVQSIATGSGMSYNPLKNIAEGAKLTKRDNPEYVSALAGGGMIRFGTMLEGNDASRVKKLIKRGVKPETILDAPEKVRAFYEKLQTGIDAYNELGNRGEEINRMALYHQLMKQGKSHAEASLMARDLMDFSMQGSFTTIRFFPFEWP